MVEFVEHFEERVNTVRASEHKPIITMRVLDELGESAQIGWWFDANRWQLDDVRSERLQLLTQNPRLRSSSGYDNPFA